MRCAEKKKNPILRKAGFILVLSGLAVIAALIFFEAVIHPTLKKLLDYKCQVTAERIISEAIFGELSDELARYGDIVSFSFDNNGKITALKTDQVRINSLKSLLNETVNDGISCIKNETVGISLGTISGVSFLYGIGPELCFNIEPKGKAQTVLKSTFKSSGINQTIHSIMLNVEAELSPMLPGFYEDVRVSYDVLIAQTVLIGEVPESYSNIILDEEYYSELADFDI